MVNLSRIQKKMLKVLTTIFYHFLYLTTLLPDSVLTFLLYLNFIAEYDGVVRISGKSRF